MKKRLAVLALLLLGVTPTAAYAVWGGQEDLTHTSVGAMYYDFDGDGITADDLICSGSNAGPTTSGEHAVFLTAGHCLPSPELGIPASDIYVSFDPDGRDGVSGLIQAVAYQQMPGYGHNAGDLRDLGVLLLPVASTSGLPAIQLPSAGYLDELKATKELKFMLVDIVGYGVVPVWDQKGPTQFDFDGVRRAGTSIITGLTKSMVLYNQQRHGIGTGSGVCFGDSGSPQFMQGTLLVVSVTSGGNGQCNANNANYRLDTPAARAFLGQFLNLP
jgi:hypothetical protein